MKVFEGKVISTKQAKTVTVVVARTVFHPVYKKMIRKVKKYHVHDENSTAKVGDKIRFRASKPFSKLKKWVILGKK